MTLDLTRNDRQLALAPLDEKVDHVRGSPGGRLIIEYGDYECPYSRQAFHAIEQVERQLGGSMRFAFRHFPLTSIHPHDLAAAAAAGALQDRFWDMHGLLFHRQRRSRTATCSGTPPSSAWTWRPSTATGPAPRWRSGSRRDVDSGLASGQVLGTPTLFIDGIVHRSGYDPPALLAALAP